MYESRVSRINVDGNDELVNLLWINDVGMQDVSFRLSPLVCSFEGAAVVAVNPSRPRGIATRVHDGADDR